jgi:hypothetical protein
LGLIPGDLEKAEAEDQEHRDDNEKANEGDETWISEKKIGSECDDSQRRNRSRDQQYLLDAIHILSFTWSFESASDPRPFVLARLKTS